jgi:3,4-dihydroxy 2-butanone 4-phosphate synthase/GTP cyclohydrolase II
VTVELVAVAQLPTRHGRFIAYGFRASDGNEHLALVKGDVAGAQGVLTRVHSECLTGDVLGSIRCDCGAQLEAALSRIGRASRSVLLYLRGHEGRGIGLVDKLRAYALQDRGRDTVEANLELGLPVDARSYADAAAMLGALGVASVRLLSNNPDKTRALAKHGIHVVDELPLITPATRENVDYLRTKQEKLGHRLALLLEQHSSSND